MRIITCTLNVVFKEQSKVKVFVLSILHRRCESFPHPDAFVRQRQSNFAHLALHTTPPEQDLEHQIQRESYQERKHE